MIMMGESIRQIWVNAVTLSCHDWEVKPQNKQTNKQKGTRRQRSGKGTIRKRFPLKQELRGGRYRTCIRQSQ